MLNRRSFSIGTVLAPTFLATARAVYAKLPEELSTSRLVYLTPIRSDGEESKCKGEVWFMLHDNDIYVVTQANAWRAEAIRKGLTSARMWVGEFGLWQRANDAFRQAPEIMTTGSIVDDKDVQSVVLDAMGTKYSDEWPVWGPRFRNALNDGSRAMLKYVVSS